MGLPVLRCELKIALEETAAKAEAYRAAVKAKSDTASSKWIYNTRKRMRLKQRTEERLSALRQAGESMHRAASKL